MANDHFIAQTYLKHFGDPSKNGMLHGYQKSTGENFPCWPKDVCREWDGDLNPLLVKKEILGDFRKLFEPRWNAAIATLLSKTLSPDDRFAIAGYFANLMVCTPTWRRIGVTVYNDHVKSFLIFSKQMKDKHGGNPDLPVDAIASLERGEISLEHDQNYIKAKTTEALLRYAWLTYHQNWTVIESPSERRFITSDNPVALHQSNLREPMTRYLPVTPCLCLAVRYDRTNVPALDPSMSPLGAVNWATVSAQGAKSINKLVAQCAEDLVFGSPFSTEIATLVKNCANFRVEADFIKLPANEPDAVYEASVVRVRETSRPIATSGN